MPDDHAAAEPARAEMLRAADAALTRLAPSLPQGAALLLRTLFAQLPADELVATAPETLAEAAASLAGFALERPAGIGKARVLPPGPGRGGRAVAEVVTDDMPFLVDSVLGALARQGRVVRQLLHPVLPVARDAAGRLQSIGQGSAPRESLMRIEIAAAPAAMLPVRATGAGDWPEVEAAIARALADVRVAVADFEPMAAQLAEAARDAKDPEISAFLRWLGEDHFVILGHRRFTLDADGTIGIDTAENHGLLRDPDMPVFDALRDLTALPAAVAAAFRDPAPLTVAKANMRSTVHRPQHCDVVATRIDGPDGAPTGIRLFLGLFAAGAYNRNPRSIPWLSGKVDRILAAAGYDREAHDGRALRNILDTWPRDELFQAPEAEILAAARRALDLTIRPRPALVVRRDPFGRFVSAIAWLPRETFDTQLREQVGGMVARAFGGTESAFYIALGDGPLARIHYIVATDPAHPVQPDPTLLEAAIAEAARGFQDRLAAALTAERGEAAAAAALTRWGEAFPTAYRETATAAQGAADLALAERALADGRATAALTRPPGADTLVLRIASPGAALALADALPLFESLDLRALEELPHRLSPRTGETVVLHAFTLAPAVPVEDARFPLMLDALAALLDGRVETDGFNRLVLRAGLTWRECWLLRAMFRWLKQVGLSFAQPSVEAALAAHPDAARLLVALFHARFDPGFAGDRVAADTEHAANWHMLLDTIENPDEDRILTRLRTLLDAVLRTNFHQGRERLSLKIDSARAGEMPAPRPWREIFVHSARMEGTHLRAGPVARGGIRWSDRREDFRTEILSLMKAQRVKNVVIVPTGAKGGFVLKRPPPTREAFQAEGIACYSTLVRGMLDITDTLAADGGLRVPEHVVRRDGDDPYLVVAADKGTATFSDIANGLSEENGFWLGDAFASGGSAGYDHKAMGITARGAWVMVARHFAEMGHDIQAQPFTCAGVGDMSGDVFGNGLLVSRQTRLVAAFDHRHIFLDPDPDPARSYDERARLFALPRSSWADYDAALISAGGGVFARNLKTMPISPQVAALLGLEGERLEPVAVMRAILRAPVDLLYFGGIGTYVKASGESQAEAGDRANDALRVDGRDIRARVLGEGANLAITQAARVEAARAGARINTDALDNAAGVATSDREVNIKILLAEAERTGALTRRQRDTLLAEMTDEVAALVLRDNRLQSLAVSLEQRLGAAALPAQAALMARLEAAGVLDRAVAGLPDAPTMAARQAAGDALTRPEIAALLPFGKLFLTEALAESALVEDPAFAPMLAAYFPTPLQDRFGGLIATHRLRRDLIATALANQVANRLGSAGLAPLLEAGPVLAVRAAWLASEAFGLEAAFDAIDLASAPAAVELEAQTALARLLGETATALLAEPAGPLEAALAALRPGVRALTTTLAAAAPPAWTEAGLPADVAALAAAAPRLGAAPVVLRLAAAAHAEPAAAAAAWAETGSAFHFDALADAARAAPAPGTLGPRARTALLEDLTQARLALAAARLAGREPDAAGAAALAREATMEGGLVALGVAARALRRLE